MTVDHEGDEYVYVQLASILRDRIRSGDLPPGRALPSARLLSQQYEVAIGTVKRAIELLRDEGLVRTVIGRGIFVTRPDRQLRLAVIGPAPQEELPEPRLVAGQRFHDLQRRLTLRVLDALLKGGDPGPPEQPGTGNAPWQAPQGQDEGGTYEAWQNMSEYGQNGLRAR